MSSQDYRADPYLAAWPPAPVPGAAGAVMRQSRKEEWKALELERRTRVWTVRGVVGDCVPLMGGAERVIDADARNNVRLKNNPQPMFLDRGNGDVVYFDLVARPNGDLRHLEVQVEAELPSDALLFGRSALSSMLDALANWWGLPLVLHHVEVASPKDGGLLGAEIVLPHLDKVGLGEIGGIELPPAFAPYSAMLREAMTSRSPFYRLLCSYRLHEGLHDLRRWVRETAQKLGSQEALPKDVRIDRGELQRAGLSPTLTEGVNTLNDLFGKLQRLRDGAAHFLLKHDGGASHLPLSDANVYLTYSQAAAVLLRHVRSGFGDLRKYYNKVIHPHMRGGAAFPTVEQRSNYIVRARREPPRGTDESG